MIILSADPTLTSNERARGFSLVELMVAMALSLVLLGGVLAIFASSRTTYETTDRLSRIQENGRFALDMIVRDVRSAGFVGCSAGRDAPFTNALNTPDSLFWNFQFPVVGFEGTGEVFDPALDVDATGAPDADPTSDAIVVRLPRGEFEPVRVTEYFQMADTTSNLTVEDVEPQLLEAGDVVLAADCQARAIFQITSNVDGVIEHEETPAAGDLPGNSTNDIGHAFTHVTRITPVQSAVYFLRTPDGRDIPSLYRRLGGGVVAEELVEGVESMQIQYGVGAASDDPLVYQRADEVDDWGDVRTVRIALLVRSMSEYGTDVGPESYEVLDEEVANPRDRHMRQVFTSTVNLRNLQPLE